MPFIKPENPKSQVTSHAGSTANTVDTAGTTTARSKPISIFASVNGYAQAEIIVGASRGQSSRD